MKTKQEAEEVLGRVAEQICEGESKYHGMSYEEGIQEALSWMLGEESGLADPDGWPFVDEE